MREQLLILGGNTAGLAAALSARRRRSSAALRILVLEAGSDFSYGACGMTYNLADPDRDPADLLVRDPGFFHQQGIELAAQHRVLDLDPVRRTLRVQRPGELIEVGWDRLVVATGSRPRQLVVPGWPANRLFAFHNLEDLRRLKGGLDAFRSVVIVGAGPLGLELCEALHSRSLGVTLLDVDTLPLPGFPTELRRRVSAELEGQGIELALGWRLLGADSPATSPTPTLRIKSLSTGEERVLAPQALINAAGLEAATDFLPLASLRHNRAGALWVDSAMRSSLDGIWAAGDCVTRDHAVPPLSGEDPAPWHPQAREARRGGRVAGWNAAGGEGAQLRLEPSPQSLALRCFNLEVARCGRLSVGAPESLGPGDRPNQVQGLLGMAPRPVASPKVAQALQVGVRTSTLGHGMPGADELDLWLEGTAEGRLRGGALLSKGPGAALRINVLAALLQQGAQVEDLLNLDLAYSPPFGPVDDPLLKAAARLAKALARAAQ